MIMRALLRKFLGILCIMIGAAFGILPFVPGILLIFVGLELLGVPLIPWEKLQSYWRRKGRDGRKVSSDTGPSEDTQK